ncbi:hypothetical protein BM533_16410 [Clostridioides difficile]|nr:hypothetical protein [Clostridioides difficile]OJT77602.1 hypothetical protein BM529_05110 [Clostridioides difficile]OJT85642.1 hypothetical protein BM533_16410 [Clostridioides difficile]HDF2339554.1 hypothetical protein [Clostridioides difficile]
MGKDFQYIKQFSFYTDKEIEERLKKSDYKYLYKWFDTDIPNDNPKLIRPSNNFEDKLVEAGIFYFAYIKFFKMNNQLYGIVAGKTKSKSVNRTSDVNFTKNLKYAPKTKWNAKEFLVLNNLEWEKSKILVIIPKQIKSEKEAKQIENWLQKEFNLFGS